MSMYIYKYTHIYIYVDMCIALYTYLWYKVAGFGVPFWGPSLKPLDPQARLARHSGRELRRTRTNSDVIEVWDQNTRLPRNLSEEATVIEMYAK